jgi:LuxR family glucitol operon transcriptional activator
MCHFGALDEALGQLMEMTLLEPMEDIFSSTRRYSIHPLTRAYAQEHLNMDVEFKKQARKRLAAHFLTFVEEYGGKSWWNWRGTEMAKFDELDIERDNILNIMDLSFEAQDWKPVVELMKRMSHPLERSGDWMKRLDYAEKALRAAMNLEDELNAAWLKADALGWTYMRRGEYQKAQSLMLDALVSMERIGNLEGTCLVLRFLGNLARETGNLLESQELLERALEMAIAEGYQDVVSDVYRHLGHLALQQKEHHRARQFYEKALAIAEQVPHGNDERVINNVLSLATAMFALGDNSQSQELYERGLKLAQNMRRQYFIGYANLGLAKLIEQQKHFEVALGLGRNALQIFDRLVAPERAEAREFVEKLEGKLSTDR